MESPAIKGLYNRLSNVIPGLRFGGIYAKKPGYHNTRSANTATNYSVVLPADKLGPSNLASALDLTMGEAEMRKRTGYLRRAALNPADGRTSYIREFIGTLNGSTVYCLIASGPGTAFREDTGRDDSHLWHIHISFYRQYANDPRAMDALFSVLSGETFEEWDRRQDMANVDDVWNLLDKGRRPANLAQTHDGGIPSSWIGEQFYTLRQEQLEMQAAITELMNRPATVEVDYPRLAQEIVRQALAQTQAPQ